MIRKVSGGGDVTSFTAQSGRQLPNPYAIAHYQKENCLFVCLAHAHVIKKISATGIISYILLLIFVGVITSFAGSGSPGCVDGMGASASFCSPWGITIDQQTGTMYVNEYSSYTIRKVTLQGDVSTLAGGKCGNSDGVGRSAMFGGLAGLCLDEKGQALVICDSVNSKLRKLDIASGEVRTICSIPTPQGIAITPTGELVIALLDQHKVALVTQKDGKYEVKSLVGSGELGYEDGNPLTCKFNQPVGISFDSKTSTCYVNDICNYKIRKFTLI